MYQWSCYSIKKKGWWKKKERVKERKKEKERETGISTSCPCRTWWSGSFRGLVYQWSRKPPSSFSAPRLYSSFCLPGMASHSCLLGKPTIPPSGPRSPRPHVSVVFLDQPGGSPDCSVNPRTALLLALSHGLMFLAHRACSWWLCEAPGGPGTMAFKLEFPGAAAGLADMGGGGGEWGE